MDQNELYAAPRRITDAGECHFYHRMDIPGHGLTIGGMWDLRENMDVYLGDIDLAGKRVLEIGPASGFVTFWMESRGAEVVSVELPLDADWDVIPDASLDTQGFLEETRQNIEFVRNAYWFTHERVGSKAKVHYGDVYALPDELGHFDIAVMAAVLLHLRDPLRVIEGCARLADSLVITEARHWDIPEDKPYMGFFSTEESPVPHVWWKISPQLLVRFGEVLGFSHNVVSFHDQLYIADGDPPRPAPLYTVVSTNGPAATSAEIQERRGLRRILRRPSVAG